MQTKSHIIIPIKNKEELQYLQSTLLETIHKISHLEEDTQDSIYWLSKILLLSHKQH